MEAPRFPDDAAGAGFRVRLRTRWSDEDNHAVLNNAVYLTLLEEARLAWCTELGAMAEGRFPFVLAQCNVRFLAPGRGGAEVAVELVVTHVGRRSFTQAYRVTETASGTVWCEAEALLVAWDQEARTSRELPDDLRAALTA